VLKVCSDRATGWLQGTIINYFVCGGFWGGGGDAASRSCALFTGWEWVGRDIYRCSYKGVWCKGGSNAGMFPLYLWLVHASLLSPDSVL